MSKIHNFEVGVCVRKISNPGIVVGLVPANISDPVFYDDCEAINRAGVGRISTGVGVERIL